MFNDEQGPFYAGTCRPGITGSGGPMPPPQHVTLRGQVMEVIKDVLADPCLERGWARRQLRELLAAYPDNPERALLEHLVITRELTAAAGDEDGPAPR